MRNVHQCKDDANLESSKANEATAKDAPSDLFREGRFCAFPKFALTPSYIQQVGGTGILFIGCLIQAYDEGRSRHDRVGNGWLAIGDEALSRWWGFRTTAGVRSARERVLNARPRFIAEFRPGHTGRVSEYKIRLTTPDDKVTFKKDQVALPPKIERRTQLRRAAEDVDLSIVQSYLDRGYSVIPVEQKKAVVPWKEFQKRIATDAEMEKWVKGNPGCGWAIVTGALSKLAVIDIDGDLGAALDHFEELGIALPETTTVKTPRGYHLWYSHPGYRVSTIADLLRDARCPTIDIRGDGGYIVAPPSRTPTGGCYAFQREVEVLPEFPKEISILIESRKKRSWDVQPEPGQEVA